MRAQHTRSRHAGLLVVESPGALAHHPLRGCWVVDAADAMDADSGSQSTDPTPPEGRGEAAGGELVQVGIFSLIVVRQEGCQLSVTTDHGQAPRRIRTVIARHDGATAWWWWLICLSRWCRSLRATRTPSSPRPRTAARGNGRGTSRCAHRDGGVCTTAWPDSQAPASRGRQACLTAVTSPRPAAAAAGGSPDPLPWRPGLAAVPVSVRVPLPSRLRPDRHHRYAHQITH